MAVYSPFVTRWHFSSSFKHVKGLYPKISLTEIFTKCTIPCNY